VYRAGGECEREREREREGERESPRCAIRRGGQWDVRHPSPPKRHLTKIRGCHNGVILRLPAEAATLFLCDRRRGGVPAARGGERGEEEKKESGKASRGNQCIYIRVNHPAIVAASCRRNAARVNLAIPPAISPSEGKGEKRRSVRTR